MTSPPVAVTCEAQPDRIAWSSDAVRETRVRSVPIIGSSKTKRASICARFSPREAHPQTFESGKDAFRREMKSSSASSTAGSIGGGSYSRSIFFQSVFARCAMS